VALTVFASRMGFFHKGSGGKGVAPGDVCLSPPPPPAGPLPVPYVNMLSAADLSKGSTTVKADGEPTALEDASEIATSTGNEPGTQGGGVVTHKTKGKGSFTSWSFTVKVEGKGVACHGDMMLQNHASKPPNCVDAAALTAFKSAPGVIHGKKCARKYNGRKHRPSRKSSQAKKVNGKACWECKRDLKALKAKLAAGAKVQTRINKLQAKIAAQKKPGSYMVHDHQPPLVVAWRMGGCHMGMAAFKKHFSTPKSVKPHCFAHQRSQGSRAAAYARNAYP
jgi:uncharacterized Zn-binding protein involved in type VI secretion